MASDTPRTDEMAYGELDTGQAVDAKFARQLERELSAAQSQIAALKADATDKVSYFEMQECLLQLVKLKGIKRRIESGGATEAEKRYYEASKEAAWGEAEYICRDMAALHAKQPENDRR